MQSRAAVMWESGNQWSVEDIELDPPKRGEVMVRIVGSGLCHSEEHVVTGDLPFALPMIGGHEGAGVVEAVGPDVDTLTPGDHVVFSFLPSCGRCPSCATGHANLCDLGAQLGAGRQILDGTSRHHARGTDLGLMCLVGAFAEHTVVNEASCVKIDPDVPLDKACLLGCGVVTGWGSAVYAGGVKPGDTVAVIGVGGIGINAVQGAAMAGASQVFAIDPVAFKLDQAKVFGATHTSPSVEEAAEIIGQATAGRMADKVIMTMGVGSGEMVGAALAMTAKRGRVVVTNIHPAAEMQFTMSGLDLTLMEKEIVGCLFGSASARVVIPQLLDYYARGQLKLDELVTRTYALDDVNQGYEDLRQGKNLRGVITF
ncbi:NDMA-dependent alcohol dehydrogenase [Nocardioides sp. WS12]|uniref:NDMA-dependent alcohol dehydrogenase n=1 Tax=Nocardioides sp. WS12 TaxID=2486272 RepID=UPI0015F882EC|nr:NDMA-dependent alcohol dehydrogenase [Nocardioides sp. WS12]